MKTNNKGIQLSGKWFCSSFRKDFDMEYQLTIKQSRNRISGSLKIQKRHQGKIESSETLNLAVSGFVWEGFFVFSAKSIDPKRLAIGADLFEIKEGGKKLEGIHSYRSLNKGGVKQIGLTFSRQRN